MRNPASPASCPWSLNPDPALAAGPEPAGVDGGIEDQLRPLLGVEVQHLLEEFASDHGHSLLELAIAGLASQPAVASVIAGATKPEQVRANAAAADWELSPEELEELSALGRDRGATGR